ncbi:hypothetical protein [Bradyrhizobium sp. 2TAF24]|uniref:hypothetical protein n=1 Tax=Bradyrhizobium sp. 2TAF24 TaxID=3233011 RepID=UPI003F935EA2
MTNDDHRVIPFRPRTLAKPPGRPLAVLQDNHAARDGRPIALNVVKSIPNAASPLNHARTDDYRHRMLINVAALMFTLLLTAIGVWLATTLADMRRTQDCVLVGRRDCGKLPVDKIIPSRPADHI